MFPDLTRDDVFRLETKRLWLRWPRAADAPAIHAIASQKDVAIQTSKIPHPYAREAADQYVLNTRQFNAAGEALNLVMTLRTGSRNLIGFISVEIMSDSHAETGRAEIGYAVHPQYWGQDYATEAVQAMVDTLFSLTPTTEIAAHVRVTNPASRRVLEKCGFTHTGNIMCASAALGGALPSDIFSLDQKVWTSLKGWRTPVLNNTIPEICPDL